MNAKTIKNDISSRKEYKSINTKVKKEMLKIVHQKSLEYFKENLFDRIENITNNNFSEKERKTSNMQIISCSKPYRKLLEIVKSKTNVSDKINQPKIYSGVCGLKNQCAFTDMTYLLCAIAEDCDLKWDQPHKSKTDAQKGDLMVFVFGIGHPLAGESIILQVDSVLPIDQRETHWSDTGYTKNNSNSRQRGCVLFKRDFSFGRWTASGNKIKQGFTLVKKNRHEWEILIDGEYKTL